MTYEYRCKQCGTVSESQHYEAPGVTLDLPCAQCGGRQVRIFSRPRIQHSRDCDPHFNQTLGREVGTRREFVSELHRKSDEMSERLGTEHRYEPIDWADRDACGVTDEGTDEKFHAERTRKGIGPKRKVIA